MEIIAVLCEHVHRLVLLFVISSQWDSYLVDAASSDGSAVPSCWVEPSPPSTTAWQEALGNNN